ncbi:MAG: hypothetical protein HY079_10310 [Elusimicrobia bacterium]|nr:hypothetical protein [Elusimicrobiota bacterium]
MSRTLLAALLIAAAAASAHATVAACVANPELDSKAYGLWITDKNNPDEVPCAAVLTQTACAPSEGAETRTFASADGHYAAVLRIAEDGAVTITLKLADAAGVGRGKAVLATYPYQRAIYRGVGVDGLQIFDDAAQTTKGIGNVMLIPTSAFTENGKTMCPAK